MRLVSKRPAAYLPPGMLCLVVGFMLCAAPSRAQTGTIFGEVADDAGDPLPGVNVVVKESGRGAATDSEGRYEILLPAGTYVVSASAVGYTREERSVVVARDEAVRVDFILSEVAIQSAEVIVTASRREQLSAGVPASLSTMTPRDIAGRNAVSLDEALRYVPGVQMAGNQVSIRGSSGFSYNTGSRVLLLIDGAPMLRPDANGIPHEAIPTERIRRIEVLKGPGSALYGGGALGGVINVVTEDYSEQPTTTISAYGGAYEPVRYAIWRENWHGADRPRPLAGVSIGHSRPLGPRAGFWAHASYRYDSGHLRLSRRRTLQSYGKISWHPSGSTRLSVLAGLNRRNSDSFLFWNGIRDPLNPGRIEFGRSDASSGSDDNLINELSLLPTLSSILAPDVLLTVRGRAFGVLIQPLDEDRRPKPISSGTAGIRYGGEAQVDYSPAPARHVTIGITGDANAARSSFFDRDAALTQPEGAVFLQWEETIADRLTVAGGARFDVYRVSSDLTEHKLSPRINAAFHGGDRWILRAAYGEGFRVPSVAERFINNSDYLPLVANLGLRPEISRSFEAGVRAFPKTGRWSTAVDGALFWSDYHRLVEPMFVPAERSFQFVNLTRARIRGAEMTIEAATPNEASRLEAGYTLLDATDLSTDRPLVFRSTHLVKISATTDLGAFHAGADVRIASRPKRVDSDFALFVKDAQVTGPMRVLDLHVGTTWNALRATLHIKNALDYYYVERPALLAPPRHFILRLSTFL